VRLEDALMMIYRRVMTGDVETPGARSPLEC
jgi:hypothetical protein